MAVSAMAHYTSSDSYLMSVLVVGVVFALVNVPSVSTWRVSARPSGNGFSEPARLKWFNITMAVLLVVSLCRCSDSPPTRDVLGSRI